MLDVEFIRKLSMKKFKIEVQEILSKIIEIEATDIEQAIYEVKKMYESEEIILNENDYITTEFTNYERPTNISERETN